MTVTTIFVAGKLGPGPATYYPKPVTSTATCSISGWNRKTKGKLKQIFF